GVDAQKNPVVFENTDAVILNPAVITAANTLCRASGSADLSSLQLQVIPSPGVIQKDADGKILSWDTLGSGIDSPFTRTSLGIAFASPMLLLREGVRTITFSLSCTGEVNLDLMRLASCYLSTQNAWFGVAADVQLAQQPSAYTMTIAVKLKATDPAIERFLINPDGIDSSWPMFKVVFNQISGSAIPPPVVQAMQIDVTVSGVEIVQLYNDFGALSTKVAYPPFGPSPVNGSNFIIGSNEIFSKPVSSLRIQLSWSALPPDFSVYYKAYNLYLNNELVITKPADTSWLKKLFGEKNPAPEPVMPDEGTPYNNDCFTVAFQVLQEQSWTPVIFNTVVVQPATVPSTAPVSSPVPVAQPALAADASNTVPPVSPNLLFVEENGQLPSLSTYASTAIPVTACDPFLQNVPLKFTEVSTSGFMKMELTGTEFGFGSGIYPNVVSAVTLNNAQLLYKDGDGVYVDSALLPFAPKLKSFSADYSASVRYSFDQSDQGPVTDSSVVKDYPVQCFLYAPFGNYPVYDNLSQPPVQKHTIGSAGSTENDPSGVPLYAAFNYDGFLFLEIDNLMPASSLNLYFELARKYVTGPVTDSKAGYYYLAAAGWLPLTVLSDGTNNLSCSGIISINVPGDITNESNLMPGNSYWIVLVANDISSVAGTIFISTNGIEVQRSVEAYLSDMTAPGLAADTITKTKTPFPQISTLQQPFS
ncbi:MAG TPA: hypothetical protein VGC08_13295, partial [Pedobacter sp.]